MTAGPGFDPYAVLGIDEDADEIVIQLAYRARIRSAHPDIAGEAGLEAAKRINLARDVLLDPEKRARIVRAGGPAAAPAGHGDRGQRPPFGSPGPRAGRWRNTSPNAAPTGPAFGPKTDRLRRFLRAVASLSRDERARVDHSLGDARAMSFERYDDYLSPDLRGRSRTLRDAVAAAWGEGVSEPAPKIEPLGLLVPNGLHVANAYAQWMLLGDFFRRELADVVLRSEHVVDAFAARCIEPWEASVRHPRHGPNGARVLAFLDTVAGMPADAAARFARAWRRDFAGPGGLPRGDSPGIWLPVPDRTPPVLRVSGFVAAVDATRIPAPRGLPSDLEPSFRYAIRLTAHALALGPTDPAMYHYLWPWREWLDTTGGSHRR